MKTLKRTIEFIDAKNRKAIIDVEITTRNGYPEFTAGGQYMGSFGQCLDQISPKTNEQRQLIDLWKEYHLKDVSKIPPNITFWPNFMGHLESLLNAIEEQEKKINKNEITTDQLMEEFGISEDLKEACIAYLNITSADDLRDFEEAYQGEYSSDEDFARDIAESLGELPAIDQWPHYCIDWKYAARELMYDYSEENGYYFRNL